LPKAGGDAKGFIVEERETAPRTERAKKKKEKKGEGLLSHNKKGDVGRVR